MAEPQILIREPKKVDDYTLEVRKDIIGLKVQFTRDYLVRQREAILADLAKYQAARQAEINEIDQLLGEMDKLGIKDKKTDVKPEVEI